jgi:8-oxo-dGTP diphosphatase
MNSEPGTRNAEQAAPTPIAIAVVENAGRYLIGRRPDGVPLAGFWEFPGGKVHADEVPAAAAARECLEESGLVVEVGKLLTEVDYLYEHGAVHLSFFDCSAIDADAAPREPFRWVPAEQLGDFEFPPANAALLELLTAAHRQC